MRWKIRGEQFPKVINELVLAAVSDIIFDQKFLDSSQAVAAVEKIKKA